MIVRSVIAIPLGWVAAVGSYIVVAIAIAIFSQKPFLPDAQHPVGWCLASLSLGFISDVIGGFVTGVVARRKEVEHAIGLVLFTLLVSVYLWSRNSNAVQVPSWYAVVSYALMSACLLGGWLCKKQRMLLEQRSAMMIRAMDKTRLAVAAVVAFVVFFFVLIWGTALGAVGLHWLVQRFLGEEPLPIVLPVFVLFLVLACVVARRLFKWIIGVREGLGESDEGRGAREEEK